MMEAGAQIVPRSSEGVGALAYPGFDPVHLNPGEHGVVSPSAAFGSDKLLKAYGGYGEISDGAAVAAAVGIGVAALVVTVGSYALLAYVIGWGASKGWKKAKGK